MEVQDLLASFASALALGDKVLLDAFEKIDSGVLNLCVCENPSLFAQACASGYVKSVQYLIDHCDVSLAAEYDGKTGLQWAALHGHTELVTVLCEAFKTMSEVPLTPPWHENSEFYLASLGGHSKVIEILMNSFPDERIRSVMSVDVIQTLLYAACRGGHMNMVRRWLLPSIDINQPLQLINSLQGCEEKVPLHAACEGGHFDVTKLLMDELQAEIKEFTARQFPQFTCDLVNKIYQPIQPGDIDEEVYYLLKGKRIHYVPALWLQPYMSNITVLDLSNNNIKSMDENIPWGLSSLKRLDLSHNQISKLTNHTEAACTQLEWVNLSHNKLSEVSLKLFQLWALTHLDLSHNVLQRLKNPFGPAGHVLSKDMLWQCYNLEVLDLSYNEIDVLPSKEDFENCQSIKRLDLSHNRLCSLPTPWPCPMEYLDVSHNQLERFPPTTEVWSGSLINLFLNNNQLDQLGENVLRLGVLVKLNVSHNKISHLAPARVWDCPALVDLNLSHNCLGAAQKVDKKNAANAIQFPSERLSHELRSLNLSNNELTHVPISVCYIKNLASLNISHNDITDLPKELAHLQECWELKMDGLKIKKADLHQLVQSGKTPEVIEHLRSQLRKVQPCHILKVLVIGPQGKGKSTVVEALVRGNASSVKMSSQLVTVTTHVLKSPGKVKIKDRADNDRPDVTLRIWELAGNQELLAFHPVMWTENSLFLLVWDITEGVAGLSIWLCNLRTQLDRISLVIVVTHKDRLPTAEVGGRVQQFHAEVNSLYSGNQESIGVYPKDDPQKIFPNLNAVVFITSKMQRQDISELRSAVYQAALRMPKAVMRPFKFVVGQMLPESYLALDKALIKKAKELKDMERERPPCLNQDELKDLVNILPTSDFDTFADQQEALSVCSELGSILHFEVWSEGLRTLYFLDPDWLARIIAKVLQSTSGRGALAYRQPMREVKERLSAEGLPFNMVAAFLQLLKHFDIGADQEENLLLPSLLPKSAPGLQLGQARDGRRLSRFYTMPFVPSRLWSRLIIGLIMAMERFSKSSWQGLNMETPQLVYWQEGINIRYSGGSIVIESAIHKAPDDGRQSTGILISILTDSSTMGDLAVIGFVTDELDSTLQSIFPHYNTNGEVFSIYALCPVCFNVRPCEGIIQGAALHFSLADCAGDLLHNEYIPCKQGNKVDLANLVPEFMLCELPKELHFNYQEMTVKEELGGGAVGKVYRGTLRDKNVAVKIFYRIPSLVDNAGEAHTAAPSRPPSDSGTSTMSSDRSRQSYFDDNTGIGRNSLSGVYANFQNISEEMRVQDRLDGRNLKVCRAFSELRQEVVILSQLQHPCLISLMGVCIRPSLMVALELAPLGSLHSVLCSHMEGRRFNRYHYQDRDKTFVPVLDRDITFKIVYQIAVGLEYLHGRNIIYRDLKPDNVLVCSLDPSDMVNVKISDYGISKFTTSQGMVGIVGTPGYMAPEIMDGQAYNEKVDIFSFSMVIYELLTGHPPFEKAGRLHQIYQLVTVEKKRPSLMEYNVIANFPFLENLMERMWEQDPHGRLSATGIKRQLEDVSFLLQYDHLVTPSEVPPITDSQRTASTATVVETCGLFLNVTCAWASQESIRTTSAMGRNNCWVWESPSSNSCDRRLSIYNLASGKPQAPICKNCPGPPVTCMAKVGPKMWVGVKGGIVEIYGRSCFDLSRGRAKVENLGADIVAIIHDRDNSMKDKFHPEGLGFVYVGLSDGTVHVYHNHCSMRGVFDKEWSRFKTLTISQQYSPALRCMCFLPHQKELIVGSVHSLVIVSTESLLVERRICLMKDVPAEFKNKIGPVQNLTFNEDTLWCSFENSPMIVELDVQSWTPTAAYCIEADLEVYITEVRLGPGLGEEGMCEECRGSSSFRQNCMEAEGEVPRPPPPPRPPRNTKPRGLTVVLNPDTKEDNAAAGVTDSSLMTLQSKGNKSLLESGELKIDQINLLPDLQGSVCDLAHRMNHMPVPSEASDTYSSTPQLYNPDDVFSSPGGERSGSIRRAVSEYQESTRRVSMRRPPPPPPTPPRRSLPSDFDGVHVQSLLCVRDTLWVGSSCGEILVIGVQKRMGADSTKSPASGGKGFFLNSTSAGYFSRRSLNLEPRQMCNLKSVRMVADMESMDVETKAKSGGIHMLVQARNMVVAVRCVSKEQDIEEVTVWDVGSAERIDSIRQYWRWLQSARTVQVD